MTRRSIREPSGFIASSVSVRAIGNWRNSGCKEELKIAVNPKYRTAKKILKQLAETHVFYELPGSECGAWDEFSTRAIGLGVNRQMAREFGGDSERIRRAATAKVSRTLGVDVTRWNSLERHAFSNWALVLGMIPDLSGWQAREKREVAQMIRAQAGRDEMRYLRLTQRQSRLRREILRLGRK